MKTKFLLLALGAAGLAVTVAHADLDITISGDIRLGRRPPPPPPAVTVVVDDGPHGPPSWAHRHWYQRNREYYYYPGADVYYRQSDHAWFYLERGQWRTGRVLPPDIRVEFDRCVPVTMTTDRPYQFHQEVAARYPATYFVSRVRIRDDHRQDRDEDHRGPAQGDRDRDDDDHGKSKGRGRH